MQAFIRSFVNSLNTFLFLLFLSDHKLYLLHLSLFYLIDSLIDSFVSLFISPFSTPRNYTVARSLVAVCALLMPHTHSLSPSLKVRLSSFSLFIFYHSSFVFHLSSFYTVIILYLHTSSLSLTLPLTNPLLFLSLFYFFAPDVVKLSSSHFSFSLLLSYFIPTSPFSSSLL